MYRQYQSRTCRLGLGTVTEQPNTRATDDDLPEQMKVRRAKRAELVERGTAPYVRTFARTRSLAGIKATYADLEAGAATGETVAVAGRVIFARNTGKLCFARLRAGDGAELQAMLSLDQVGEQALADWKHLVDIGDLIGVEGEVITSKRGELSVMATTWTMIAKALRPLPVEHRALTEEMRIRQRYVDLIVNSRSREIVRTRATVVRSIRETLYNRGFVEVETPTLQQVHGGSARPFATQVNAFDMPVTLRTNLELALKRAVVGGVDKVYEIGRVFRNEGVDSTHSPEFTMLEAYEAFGDYDTMAELTRELVLDAARALAYTTIEVDGVTIDLEQPWQRVTLHDAVSRAAEETITIDTPDDMLRALADKNDVDLDPEWGHGEIVLELFEKLVEHTLMQPTFVCDYPASVRPLAAPRQDDPRLNEAWDLIIGGIELAPAYTELVDPVIQRERMEQQARLAALGDMDAMELDEDFLRAMEYGMPPMGGMGLGVDRLVMLLTGVGIRETILFPFVKPEV
jgi:lysyl-tRNA synthetase class 2